jgi:hypothetical protein
MNSGSPAFGSSCSTYPLFSQSDFTRSRRSVDACLPQIDDCKSLSLRASGGSTSPHSLSPGVITPKSMIFDTCPFSQIDGTKGLFTPISKGTHDYPPSNFSRSDGHDPTNTDVFTDRRFTVIVGPQRAHSLSESSTSAI